MKPVRFATSAALAAAMMMPGTGSQAGPAQPPAPVQGERQAREPLCRRAAPLPPMPAEPAVDRGQREEGAFDASSPRPPLASPMPMPAPEAMPSVPPPVSMAPAPPAPPPPPPPPPSPPPPAVSGDVTVTGARVSRREYSSPIAVTTVDSGPERSSAPGAPGAARNEPQAGQLTAGDHDDLLNPELYARYVREAGAGLDVKGVTVLDTRRAFVVEVQDDRGRPVPFAQVTLTCADGNRLSLATVADGTAVFFPEVDHLGENVRVEVAKEGRRDGGSRLVSVAGRNADQRHRVRLPVAVQTARRFDLFLAVDTTGSMSDELEFVKSELRSILGDIARAHPNLDIRVGLLVYRDEGDEYVTRTFPFTRRVEDIQEGVRAQRASGGGDMPEAMDEALARAVSQDWRPDAVRALVLVADAPPHAANMERIWAVAEAARANRIHIVPVAASGVDDHAQFVMRGMAALTQSRYLFLTDDSGIGNAHAEPSVDCYQVTRLDALVRRVLDSLISGRRVEARPQEVIRSVGNYQGGRCLLPQGWRAEG